MGRKVCARLPEKRGYPGAGKNSPEEKINQLLSCELSIPILTIKNTVESLVNWEITGLVPRLPTEGGQRLAEIHAPALRHLWRT